MSQFCCFCNYSRSTFLDRALLDTIVVQAHPCAKESVVVASEFLLKRESGRYLLTDPLEAFYQNELEGRPTLLFNRPMYIHTFDAYKIQEESVQIFKLSTLEELDFEIPDDKANQHVEVSTLNSSRSTNPFHPLSLTLLCKAGYVILNKIPASAKIGEPQFIQEELIPQIKARKEEEEIQYQRRLEARAAALLQERIKRESTTIKQESTPDPNSDEEEDGPPPLIPADSESDEDSSPPPLISSLPDNSNSTLPRQADTDTELSTDKNETIRVQTPEPEHEDEDDLQPPHQTRNKRSKENARKMWWGWKTKMKTSP